MTNSADDAFAAAAAQTRKARQEWKDQQRRLAQRRQSDNSVADGLLRRFAERMRGTESTDIVLGDGPATVRYRQDGLFKRTPVLEYLTPDKVRGWAFATGPTYCHYGKDVTSHGTGGWHDLPDTTTYKFLAVDTSGQLYLVRSEKEPKALGLVKTPSVNGRGNSEGFSTSGGPWNGEGLHVLHWCGRSGPDTRWEKDGEERQLNEQLLAAFMNEANEIDKFLAPGLAAALEQMGR